MWKGKAVSHGIGIGPAAVWGHSTASTDLTPLPEGSVQAEVARLEAAVAAARAELQMLHADAAERLGAQTAAIMEAHLLMLDDPALVGEVIDRIGSQKMAAPGLLVAVSEEVAAVFASLDDPYLRERAADVRDVAARLVRHLTGGGGLGTVPAGSVLVADDLPPSELVSLPAGHLAGVVLARGGETSHTAILARSMAIPMVMALGSAVLEITPGATVIVDGTTGNVLASPNPETLQLYRSRAAELVRELEELAGIVTLPAETADGHRVQLAANIGSAAEAQVARKAGAEGVGLFRTEFLFLDRPDAPTEEEQYLAYRGAVEAMAPHPVLIRTLDIGGDKPLPYLGIEREENPFLGWRGIRLCQGFVDLFRTQLRAILRASAHGRVQMMVPMVSTRSEIVWVKEQVESVSAELTAAGIPGGEIEIGIMVETPAAAIMADELAPLVNFFSIGTNDLTQYTMAVDRLNPKVAALYDPFHPAVLRMVKLVVDGAHRHGRWVGMCGELAGDPLATPILLGLELDELSMSAPHVGRVKRVVRTLTMDAARSLAAKALASGDGAAVRTLLQ